MPSSLPNLEYADEAFLDSEIVDGAVERSVSNGVPYPAWPGVRQFLPAGFDASQGIKRLHPNDHPFVTVGQIMIGQ